ncbi:NifU family protein [Microvirga sp. W0021]|uniref:NifU family protein n=1 Tax=Hohaiivirga grylli TaxID=3133970 RepID=A0ABV0BFH9_9HYPH
MFIQTETTPNPDTLKFLPGRIVLEQGTFEARNLSEAEHSPLAGRILSIPGIAGIFYGYDFISVTKSDGEWQHLKPAILGAIMEFFLSGSPLISAAGIAAEQPEEEFFDEQDTEVVTTIKQLLDERVRPAVASDGGDITFRGFRDGVVYLSMKGACSGCPSSTATLKHGIQNLLRHYLPDVSSVEAV